MHIDYVFLVLEYFHINYWNFGTSLVQTCGLYIIHQTIVMADNTEHFEEVFG